MFLKRLTITGFKSFANKTVLDFEPGMTAIVGPNGSGKSNVADAIRWAMGEQSKGKLRLKDREEVVFSGTEKRARASYAEVIMLFDNETSTFPLDATEIEIARRLYRSGESDYRLNGKSVRFFEVSALLAEAGFGRDSYAVVGQGMIDNLLISSPVERKLLFEEAAGIRGFELKRSEAMKRLQATEVNLVRIRDIRHQLTPQLEKLKAAMSAAERRNTLVEQVAALRQEILNAYAHWINETSKSLELKRVQTDEAISQTRDTIGGLEAEIEKIRRISQDEHDAQSAALASLNILEEERDALSVGMAERQVRLAELQSSAAMVKADENRLGALRSKYDAVQTKISEIETELENNAKAAVRSEAAVAKATAEIKKSEDRLRELRARTTDGSQRQYVDHALGLVKTMAQHLSAPENLPVEELRLLVHKTGRLLSYASKTGELDVLEELRNAQMGLESLMRRRETALEHQSNIVLSRRSLEIDLSFQREEGKRLKSEINRITEQIKQLDFSAQHEALRAAETAASKRLKEVNAALIEQRQAISGMLSSHRGDGQALKATELERSRAYLATLLNDAESNEQKLAELQSSRLKMASLKEQWQITPNPVQGDISTLEKQLEAAEVRLEAESAYVSQVESDYQEATQREMELVRQLEDLEAAQSNLHEVVKHLDTSIRTRFEENFAGIAMHFDQAFARLFDGGSAGLQLARDESGEYGINIKVNPKGKRLSSLEILSGGERALAGVALLAAILEVNPSPFIVLDEIDAALDEANSGRLATILQELAAKSQLIVITHNRQTMEAAKVLFGISMNDHHVSHLLSLRLEDATQLAAR